MSPLVVIVGETASGKSTLALALAEKFNGEIVCADSWTVYKGFDIGTAKPTTRDLTRVPHHLLDVADPKEGFSAAVFKRLANTAITDIQNRGKLPFLVGGTGLYINSVIFDYGFLPPSSPQLRAELNELSLTELLTRVEEVGFDITDIDLHNKRRVIRLIENNGVRPSRKSLREQTIILGLHMPREQLSDNIVRRVDAMLAAGLEQEVQVLAAMYGWEVEPMKGIGYREWQPYFAGQQSLAETRQRIIKASLDLAKRQRTWFKGNKSIHWLLTERKTTEAVDLLTTFLNT
jgi:tRNA dimethylallyltransferase